MKRLLLTVGRKKCPYRCAYCFTDFSQYEPPLTLEDVEADPLLIVGIDVVYPACDVDLFALKRWHRELERVASLGLSISLSTKTALDGESIGKLKGISDRMAARGDLLKVAISISNRSRCDELEPRAPAYPERIRTLERLSSAGIQTALVLRPLLVDVAPDEYQSIVEEAAPFADCILTGPEHLDDDPGHLRHRPHAPHPQPDKRLVPWAVGTPRWSSRNAPAQERAVRRAAAGLGLEVFESDLDLMAELLRRQATADPANAPRLLANAPHR